jgi:hypothetical protein
MNKFWNFIKGPSDIYVSEDGGFVAIANKYIRRANDDKFSKDEQIAFFYKCNVPNCAKCSWSGVCGQCKSQYSLVSDKCLSAASSEQLPSSEIFLRDEE